jgi:hypothetical protein
MGKCVEKECGKLLINRAKAMIISRHLPGYN